jgi:molecular chaperone DnaK
MVAAAEKALKDAGDKAPSDVKTKVEEKIKGVKDVLAKEDAGKEEIETATKDLSDTLSQIGQAMYGQQGGAPGGQPGDQGQPQSDDSSTSDDSKKSDKKKDEKVEEGEVVE